MTMRTCQACDNETGNTSFTACEKMFGFGDRFEYFECSKCGCVQIAHPPDDMGKYYPANYYSFGAPEAQQDSFLKGLLRRQRAKYLLHGRNAIGLILAKVLGAPDFYRWFRRAHVDFDSRIADVGCGQGDLLRILRQEGFSDLTGVDVFADGSGLAECGITFLSKDIRAVDGPFDFVMLNHSFEHMPAPLSAMQALARVVKPDGYVLVRTPVAGTFAWRTYRANWVQLDAPRHFFLHTSQSIQTLADRAGLELADTIFDSTELQLWGSEQYLKGIALTASNSYWTYPDASIFTEQEIEAFKKRAAELNAQDDGDQACFFLHKPPQAAPICATKSQP